METSFNDSEHPVSIDSKYCDILLWNILLILLALCNIELIKTQSMLILLCRATLFILMKPKAPKDKQAFLFRTT